MQANRSKDTGPEVALRRILHAQGLRYRVNYRPLAGIRRTADVVFPRRRVAVFVDGCFWHGCPEHYRAPKANSDYWRLKITRNVERDAEINQLLAAHGWAVLRFWSHEDPGNVARSIIRVLELADSDVR